MCTPTPPLGPQDSGYQSLELKYYEEERVKQKCAEKEKKKHKKASMTREQNKNDRKTPRCGKKAKEKALDTKGLCAQRLKIEDRLSYTSCNMLTLISSRNLQTSKAPLESQAQSISLSYLIKHL